MPTGYTSEILEGIDFKTFLMRCARAFGACIDMRDEPLDAPIEEFIVSNHHKAALINAEKSMKEFLGIPASRLEGLARKEFRETVQSIKTRIKEKMAEKEKYLSMLDEVIKWEPPTKGHIGLKTFMVEQIEDTVKFDCNIEYLQKELKELRLQTAAEYKAGRIKGLRYDIEYHKKGYAEEVARVKERNEWVKALRDSITKETK